MDQIHIETIKELRDWLINHHKNTQSIWLVKWKKQAGMPYIAYDEIVDQLICFGWVDSLPRKLDDRRSMILISPRNPKSNWSAINKKRVKRLTENQQMHPAGIKAVQLAKINGTWDFLNDVEALILPTDLVVELNKYEKAAFYFERFPPSSKRGILEWIKSAKQPVTRQKRIADTALKAAINVKANHPKGRDSGPKET